MADKPLKSLDSVDWHSLHHAYGEADDVPELIRGLYSSDVSMQRRSLQDLFGNIWHQGTVYEATAEAVPFLVDALKRAPQAVRPGVASLLACIADGTGYLAVHAQNESSRSMWEQILETQGKKLYEEQSREQETLKRVRIATEPAIPLLIPFLSDPDAEVRSCIPSAFKAYPKLASETVPLLEAALKNEADESVRTEIERALVKLRG
ncbi:MAG: HEAT repeat domain-containing protein [Planctomycetota bacterium]